MFKILPAGDAAITFEYGNEIDITLSSIVLRAAQMLKEAALAGIAEIGPTFRSFTVSFDPRVTSAAIIEQAVCSHVELRQINNAPRRVWSLPACHDGELASDLPSIADRLGMETGELVRLHASRTYYVYMLGFLPGQPYLGNIDEQIRLPRLKVPKSAPAGAIGIAMNMTSIWPMHTPCGWNVIARTPSLFWQNDKPIMSPGDLVEFVPVTRDAYDALAASPCPPNARIIA